MPHKAPAAESGEHRRRAPPGGADAMQKPVLTIALVALLPALAACGGSHSDSSETASAVTLRSAGLTVTVGKDPFTISIANRGGTLLAEAPAVAVGSLTYWRAEAEEHLLRALAPFARDGGRVTFTVETSEGADATRRVGLRRRRHPRGRAHRRRRRSPSARPVTPSSPPPASATTASPNASSPTAASHRRAR